MLQFTPIATQCRTSAGFRKCGFAHRSSRDIVVVPLAHSTKTAPFALSRPAGVLAAGALWLSVGLGMPSASLAKLPAGLSANSGNPYADVMKSKPKQSVEALYEVR
jgi:hypothetical protein